jgi:hypothetical protein
MAFRRGLNLLMDNKTRGPTERWVKVALRDEVVAFVDGWSERTGLPVKRLLKWLGITPGKYHAWQGRWGLAA